MDVYIMIFFGVVGYFMNKFSFDAAPLGAGHGSGAYAGACFAAVSHSFCRKPDHFLSEANIADHHGCRFSAALLRIRKVWS